MTSLLEIVLFFLSGDFAGPMKLDLYLAIARLLMSLNEQLKSLLNEEEIKNCKEFMKRNKKNLFFKKNGKKPIYELQFDNENELMLEDGCPIININSYDTRFNAVKSTRRVIYQEKMQDTLRSLHNIVSPDGSVTCQPGGINVMSKMFNSKFYYKGNNDAIKSFLKNCVTCQINNPLHSTEKAPPIPIRSYMPLMRVQYDLIDMAPSTRKYMQSNIWGVSLYSGH